MILVFFVLIGCSLNAYAVEEVDADKMNQIVNQVITPLMQQNQIPGMAVAVTWNGKNYFYNYGIASKKRHQPVTNHTLFEIGSLTKTFAGTLAAYAAENNPFSLSYI